MLAPTLEHHHHRGLRVVALGGLLGDGAGMGEEEDLNGQGQASVQGDDDDEQTLAGLAVGGAENGVEVAQQEGDGEAEADADKGPVEDVDRGPRDAGDGDPDEVGVAVQGPALEQVGRVAAKVAQDDEQHHGDEEGVAVDEAGSAWGIHVRRRGRRHRGELWDLPLNSRKS